MRKGGLDGLWKEIVARYLAMAAKSKPAPVPDGKVEPASTPVTAQEHVVQRQAVALKRARRKRKPVHQAESRVESATPVPGPTPAQATSHEWRGRPSARAQALVREQLANGPKCGEEVQAAAYLASASALGSPRFWLLIGFSAIRLSPAARRRRRALLRLTSLS
jgi:hypothetical protein